MSTALRWLQMFQKLADHKSKTYLRTVFDYILRLWPYHTLLDLHSMRQINFLPAPIDYIPLELHLWDLRRGWQSSCWHGDARVSESRAEVRARRFIFVSSERQPNTSQPIGSKERVSLKEISASGNAVCHERYLLCEILFFLNILI